jgi:hypothetical protein
LLPHCVGVASGLTYFCEKGIEPSRDLADGGDEAGGAGYYGERVDHYVQSCWSGGIMTSAHGSSQYEKEDMSVPS